MRVRATVMLPSELQLFYGNEDAQNFFLYGTVPRVSET
jgi:hypothetical protein